MSAPPKGDRKCRVAVRAQPTVSNPPGEANHFGAELRAFLFRVQARRWLLECRFHLRSADPSSLFVGLLPNLALTKTAPRSQSRPSHRGARPLLPSWI